MTRKYNEGIEPMLSSCSSLVTHLCKEESIRLLELLSLLDEFRPCLKAKKGSDALIVELLDWEGLAKVDAKGAKKSHSAYSRSSPLR